MYTMARASRSTIERFFGDEAPHPAVPAIGRSVQSTARPFVGPHAHAEYEVCLIERGGVDWFVGDSAYHVPSGSVFITRPGERHGSRDRRLQPCALRWLQIDPRRDRAIRALFAAGDPGTRRVWCAPRELGVLHEQMLAECRASRVDSGAVLAAQLGLFVSLLFRAARDGVDADAWPEPVRRVTQAVAAAPEQRWTLDAMTGVAGVGKTRLLQLFEKHLGVTPVAYALRQRLRRGQELLRATDRPVTDIALELSFSSSQHFATAFGKQYGLTPTACRRSPQF